MGKLSLVTNSALLGHEVVCVFYFAPNFKYLFMCYTYFMENQEKCNRCDMPAKYSDVDEVSDGQYDVVGFCQCHITNYLIS